MYDDISIACISKRSTGMKLILVLFESYRMEDFFGFRKPLLNTFAAGLIQAVRKKQLFRTWLCG